MQQLPASFFLIQPFVIMSVVQAFTKKARYLSHLFCESAAAISCVSRISFLVHPSAICLSCLLCVATRKEPACQCRRRKRHGFNPWVRKITWRRAWLLTPVFFPGESHGQRSLVGFSAQGCTELNTTEVTQHTRTFTLEKSVGYF